MKKAIRIFSIVVIVCALGYMVFLALPRVSAQEAFEDFPIGQSRLVDYDVNHSVWETMSNREKVDQMRDWLLITLVSDSGLSPQEVNKTLYDLPPVRYGYLEPVANFEYEDVRSRYIGDGTVIALIPVTSPGERLERLGRIADEHRKNVGEIPKSIEVFEYQIHLNDLSAEVVRHQALDAKTIFTEENGYVEKDVKSFDDLKQFMGKIDDLTFARVSGSTITLGGRKIKGRPYRGIGAEDVAAVWQSEEKIATQTDPIEEKINAFNRRWENRTYISPIEKMNLDRQYEREEALLKKEINELKKVHKGSFANGSGFSLDPTFDYDGLKRFFDYELAPSLAYSGFLTPADFFDNGELGSTHTSPKDVSDALASGNADPLYELLQKVSQTHPDLANIIEDHIRSEFGFQEARYDGYIEGTEVGMVLFYTDLLAKLWALDYLNATPTRYIDDFKPLPGLTISPIYRREMDELTSTRLWFGPHDKGFQAIDDGDGLVFARNATRVYAASATSLQPGKESEANAASAAFLGWWNEHYEEIARYEPQYQRLNEIMKWSLLISWLNDKDKGGTLGFLKSVPVDHSNWFPEWAKQQSDLRFKNWGEACGKDFNERSLREQPPVCFYPKKYKGSKYESLPQLTSRGYRSFGETHYLSGGVSLAEKGLFKERLPLSSSTKVEGLMRRSNLKYEIGLTGDRLTTLDGIKYSFKAVSQETSQVVSQAKTGAKLRGRYSEMIPDSEVERTITQNEAGFNLVTKTGGAELGNLKVTKTGNGFSVGWRSLEVDHAQSLARKLSISNDPASVIANNQHIDSAITLPGGKYLVKFNNSERWVKLAVDRDPPAQLAYEWKSRAADLTEGSRTLNIKWLPDNDLSAEVGNAFFVLKRESGGAPMQIALSDAKPHSATAAVEFQIDGAKVKGVKNLQTGEIYFARKDLPRGVQASPDKLGRAVNKSSSSSRSFHGNTDDVLQDILASPIDNSKRLSKAYAEGVSDAKRLLGDKQYGRAFDVYNNLIDVYGPQPELLVGKRLAEISQRSPKIGQTVKGALQEGVNPNSRNFFDEINSRLARDGLIPEGDSLIMRVRGRGVFIDYSLGSFPSGKPVSPQAVPDKGFVLFVEDSPGLNNLNWDVSIHRTIEEVVGLNLGELREVAYINIADFRPSMLLAPPESAAGANTLAQARVVRFRPHYVTRFYYTSGGSDDDDDEEKKPDTRIFIVVPKTKTM